MTAHPKRGRYSDTVDDVRSRLLAYLRNHTGATDDTFLSGLLQSCNAWSARGARPLDQYLAEHPDVFRTPDPRCPLAIVILTEKLEGLWV